MEESKYSKFKHIFKNGEILKNNNGYLYKVVNVIDQNNVVFQRELDGEKVLAIYPRMYHKTTDNTAVDVLEWGIGKYL